MRTGILTLAAVLGGTMVANAQMDIGAKLGLNYNIWSAAEGDQFPSGGDKPESESGIGFHVGGYMNIPFSDMLGFRTEVLFSTRGVKENIDEVETGSVLGVEYSAKTTGEAKVRASYLEVPLLLNITPSEAFSVHVGPVVALRMGWQIEADQTTSTTINGQTSSQSTSYSSTEDKGIRGTDIGLAAGLVYGLESGLNFGLRFTRSLTTINDETSDGVLGSSDFVKYNQNILQVSVGYTFLKH
jgi:hypothetical protein